VVLVGGKLIVVKHRMNPKLFTPEENEMKNKNYKGEGGLNTIIGKDSKIEGNIEVEGGLRVDGAVKGKISATDTLNVGESGMVEAEVDVKIAVIGGKVMGNILAHEKIELQSKAMVEGDITTKNLIVEEGAVFHGNCSMKSSSDMYLKTHSNAINQKAHVSGVIPPD
jgi:cytoskeletal protein CcmA (bactofilin family)